MANIFKSHDELEAKIKSPARWTLEEIRDAFAWQIGAAGHVRIQAEIAILNVEAVQEFDTASRTLTQQLIDETQRLVGMTRGLIGLTWVLVGLTLVLIYLTFQLAHPAKQATHSAPTRPTMGRAWP